MHMFTHTFVSKQTSLFLGLFLLAFLLITPKFADAATCSFTRDLQLGVVGEDVRCLQQYLNSNGYVITTSGGGSVGNETTEFKSLTQAAIIRWQQANNISPAAGYFGAR